MPFGLVFRKAVFCHQGEQHVIPNLEETGRTADEFAWNFRCYTKDGLYLKAVFDGEGPSIHRLPYVKTNCSGTFDVVNNSLAKAALRLERQGEIVEEMETTTGAVLEMAGREN